MKLANALTPETAQAAIEYLRRSPIRGEEAPAFLRVVSDLQAVAQSPGPWQMIDIDAEARLARLTKERDEAMAQLAGAMSQREA